MFKVSEIPIRTSVTVKVPYMMCDLWGLNCATRPIKFIFTVCFLFYYFIQKSNLESFTRSHVHTHTHHCQKELHTHCQKRRKKR